MPVIDLNCGLCAFIPLTNTDTEPLKPFKESHWIRLNVISHHD